MKLPKTAREGRIFGRTYSIPNRRMELQVLVRPNPPLYSGMSLGWQPWLLLGLCSEPGDTGFMTHCLLNTICLMLGMAWFALCCTAGTAAAQTLNLRSIEEKLLFYPARYPEGDWKPGKLPIEDVKFAAADGTKLHGWFVDPAGAKFVILFCHGNAGNVTHRRDILSRAASLKATVLLLDYRGYGKSDGTPTEEGVYSDARAARKWLAARMKIPEKDVVLWGESIGTAVAVDLAAKDSARGLILENPLSTLADVAAFHYGAAAALLSSGFDSVSKIKQYHGPLLVFHAANDTIVPLRFGKKLFAAANQPKQLIILSGRDHNDPRTPAMFAAVRTFLNKLK